MRRPRYRSACAEWGQLLLRVVKFLVQCLQEMGGYFIVNGNERIIRMLVMPRRNYVSTIVLDEQQQCDEY